jgi:hypothetical protein
MIDEGDCGVIGGIKIGRGNRSTRRKPAPAPLCPPQNPLDQIRARTRAAAVGSQRLTAWAMARPIPKLLIIKAETVLYWRTMCLNMSKTDIFVAACETNMQTTVHLPCQRELTVSFLYSPPEIGTTYTKMQVTKAEKSVRKTTKICCSAFGKFIPLYYFQIQGKGTGFFWFMEHGQKYQRVATSARSIMPFGFSIFIRIDLLALLFFSTR